MLAATCTFCCSLLVLTSCLKHTAFLVALARAWLSALSSLPRSLTPCQYTRDTTPTLRRPARGGRRVWFVGRRAAGGRQDEHAPGGVRLAAPLRRTATPSPRLPLPTGTFGISLLFLPPSFSIYLLFLLWSGASSGLWLSTYFLCSICNSCLFLPSCDCASAAWPSICIFLYFSPVSLLKLIQRSPQAHVLTSASLASFPDRLYSLQQHCGIMRRDALQKLPLARIQQPRCYTARRCAAGNRATRYR